MNDPFYLQQYHYRTPPRLWSTKSFPTNPIEPQVLIDEVANQLQLYGNVIPHKMPIMVAELCKGFNECIRLNKTGDMPQTLIFSPKTGSAKSTSAKAYISLLRDVSSLVIVPRVDDAISYCNDINKWSNDPDCARCYYKVSEQNSDCAVRVDHKHINDFRCIVITHAMLRVISKYSERSVADALKEKQRDLVIVDERLSLFQTHEISKDEVRELIDIFARIKKDTHYDLTSLQEPLMMLLPIISKLESVGYEIKQKVIPVNGRLEDELRQIYDYTDINFKMIDVLINDKNVRFAQSSTLFKRSDIIEEDAKKIVLGKMHALEQILKNEFYCFKSGEHTKLISTENLRHAFGSIVVLDATAEINQIYETRSIAQHMQTMHMETTDPRTYTNLTINIATGYKQSRDAIYKNASKNERDEAIKYLQIAKSLLIAEEDKLLVITYKDFRNLMEEQNTESRIEFTHWGNHVGKNDWSRCNKVMIVGWNYLTEDVHYNNFIHAVGSQEFSDELVNEATIKSYKVTQMVDDLVQAAMRCSARKTIDENGNCTPSELYLFRPDHEEGKTIMSHFVDEFNGAVTKEWIPEHAEIVAKKSKSTDNADLIIKYLKDKVKTAADVYMKTIIDETGMESYTVSRTIKSEYFRQKLGEEGFLEHKFDGKSKGFLLKK
jgi:hypothetical protein